MFDKKYKKALKVLDNEINFYDKMFRKTIALMMNRCLRNLRSISRSGLHYQTLDGNLLRLLEICNRIS